MTHFLIDTHCHLSFPAFKEDWEAVARRALLSNIGMVIVGTNFETSQQAIEIAECIGDGAVAAIGLHPNHLAKDSVERSLFQGKEYTYSSQAEIFDKRRFFTIAKSRKVVAVGEAGLDYFHLDDFRSPDMSREEYVALQKETLYEILGFAREIDQPHIFHCRDAYDDFVDIVKDFSADGAARGVVHCFTGTVEQARKILDLGLLIGFTGIVTFPNAQRLQDVASFVPLDRLLLETDAPYLAPQPVRGKRNEPSSVRYVAEEIARLKGVSIDVVASKTVANTKSLFSF